MPLQDLSTEANIEFKRKTGNTIPDHLLGLDISFDHTLFSADGHYAGIEGGIPGEKAWLLSDYFEATVEPCQVSVYHQNFLHNFNMYSQ